VKFQSYRSVPGQWRDSDSGKVLDGITGLVRDCVVEAPDVRSAMRMLRNSLNPSPVVSVVDENDQWAQRKIRGLL
jgi:hypothetical protein